MYISMDLYIKQNQLGILEDLYKCILEIAVIALYSILPVDFVFLMQLVPCSIPPFFYLISWAVPPRISALFCG